MLAEQVRIAHQRHDDLTAALVQSWQDRALTIHCRKGCAACCTLAVHAAYPEAVLVATQLDETRKQVLEAHVNHLRSVLRDITNMPDYLRRHRTIGPCPFLAGDGACGIYRMRPLTCRALLSTRPAEWCAVDFTTLDPFDRQLYEAGLDRSLVAWPTHYVAATQETARRMETDLLTAMQGTGGWSLSGNLPLLVWLADERRLGRAGLTAGGADEILAGLGLGGTPALDFSTRTGSDQ